MSRSPALTDDEALAAIDRAADMLFYRRGVVGVSMADVRTAAGVSLRRLYGLCPSKAELISRWLQYRHRVWMSGYTEAVEAHLASGGTPTDAVFDALAEWMTATDFRGCGFINTHAELSELTETHRAIIRDHKHAVSQYLATVVANAAAVAVLVDGAIVQASIFAEVTPIEQAKRAALALERVGV